MNAPSAESAGTAQAPAGSGLSRYRACCKSVKQAKEKGGPKAALMLKLCSIARLFAVAQELKQEHEHVDEVEVETKRTHDGFAALCGCIVTFKVHLFDLLCVIRCKTCKDQNAEA